MRVLVFIVLLAFFTVMLWGLRHVFAAVEARAYARRMARAKWEVHPRTLPNGDRQLWLTRAGEEDFLFDTVCVDDTGLVNPTRWDNAVVRAEQQAYEFDTLRRIQG